MRLLVRLLIHVHVKTLYNRSLFLEARFGDVLSEIESGAVLMVFLEVPVTWLTIAEHSIEC